MCHGFPPCVLRIVSDKCSAYALRPLRRTAYFPLAFARRPHRANGPGAWRCRGRYYQQTGVSSGMARTQGTCDAAWGRLGPTPAHYEIIEPKRFSRRVAEAAEDPEVAEIRRVLRDRSFSGSARLALPASPRKIRFSLRALPACAWHADRRLCVSNCNTWVESRTGCGDVTLLRKSPPPSPPPRWGEGRGGGR